MKKILIPLFAVSLGVLMGLAEPVPSMEKESKSTTPVVAAVPAEYYRQMEAEKASRSALRAAVDKHKADKVKAAKIAKDKKVAAAKKKKAALLAKKREEARLAQIAWNKAQKKKAEAKKKALSQQPPAVSEAPRISTGSPKAYAMSKVGAEQFGCLDLLWMKESGWNTFAQNPSSGAYGIPQSLPGSKMASAGSDWQTNPITQINWGLGYINSRYGSPCNAWAHSQSMGWY